MSISFTVASPSQKKDLLVLGLQPDRFGRLPEPDLIKKAYRSKALLCHPDKNPNASNNAAFLQLQGAYENLTSPQKLKEEKLKQQQQQADVGASPSSTPRNGAVNKNSQYGAGYTYNVPKTSAYSRTRTPPATSSSSSSTSSSSRPPFSTKPPSKFAATPNSPKTPLSTSSAFSSNTSNNNPNSTSYHHNGYYHHSPSSSSTSKGHHPRSSTPTSSSSSSRRSSFVNTSSSPSSSSHFSNINQNQNLVPGTPLIPPPFAVSSTANTRPHSRSFLNSTNLSSTYSHSSTATSQNHMNRLIAPFPAFLVDGKTYQFETDPSAFGIYSKHLRHGDTAKISVPVFSPELGQEVETTMTGIVIGVAADNNLYWWKIETSSSENRHHQHQQQESLENVATFLAPKIPSTAFQQSHKVTVVKQKVPLMDPLYFGNHNNNNNTNSHSFSSSNSTSSSTPSPSSLASSLSGANKQNVMSHHHHQQQQKYSSSDEKKSFLTIEELMSVELQNRMRIAKVYDMWLGEAIWCFNLPTFANADAVRFSRVVVR